MEAVAALENWPAPQERFVVVLFCPFKFPLYNCPMREWGLTAEAPLSLRIAADARMTVPSYVDDQIWELRLEGGSPPALALETTYGLRARSMRIFPGFRLDQDTWIDPLDFHAPPIVGSFLPNYLRISFEPALDLRVVAEYWAKESNLVGGRFTLYNASAESILPEMLVHAQLQPGENPQTMTSVSHQGVTVLQGSTGALAPLLFLSGGPRAAIAPYPALSVRPRLDPGASEVFTWAHSACAELQDSLALARELMSIHWDAEIARIEQANSGLVDVETGDPEWDAAFSLAQTISIASFVGPTRHLPHSSIVEERSPDRGYSAYPEGRDHDWGWDGVSASSAYVTILQILPSAPELAKGTLLNFLASQVPNGAIDWSPGLGGQRSGLQCVPLLATLAWRIYSQTEDREFLSDVYQRLNGFIDSWFGESHDIDADGHPEWSRTSQSGFEDWPAYDRAHYWGQGLDIALAETPDLISYLYREINALIEMGRALGQTEHDQDLGSRLLLLKEAIERTWSEKESCYLSQDRDLGQTVIGSRLGIGQGKFEIEVDREFDPHIRVLVRVRGDEKEQRALKVVIHGKTGSSRKRKHELVGSSFQWIEDLGTAATADVYARIEKIVISGLSSEAKIEVRIADYSRPDHTGLLPLWAGVPERKRADQLIRQNLKNEKRYRREFGIPGWPADGLAYRNASVQIRPNLMIGEGLVDQGYLKEAVDLMTRLMRACTHSLHQDRAFRESYHPDQPGGAGKLGHSSGVAPLSLFLYVLGVRLVSPTKIALRGHNPFPWPVKLSWRGVHVVWDDKEAVVRFPDGSEAEVTGPQVQLVEQNEA